MDASESSNSLGLGPAPTASQHALDRSDIEAAFKWLSKDGRKITREDIRVRLDSYFPHLGIRDLKTLLGGKEEMTFEGLVDMVLKHDGADIQPVEEAFQYYDREGTGFIPHSMLKNMVSLTDKNGFVYKNDLSLLMGVFDGDHDGQINLEDFRRISHRNPIDVDVRFVD